MSAAADASPPLVVACLCAAWCTSCREYQPLFERLAREQALGAQFVWIDIEDDEALLGGIEVEDFPTLLIGRGDAVVFYGPVMPHAQTLVRLLQAAGADALSTSSDAALGALLVQVRRRAGASTR